MLHTIHTLLLNVYLHKLNDYSSIGLAVFEKSDLQTLTSF